ncbi:hypothetical protein ACOSP7_015935 [Xanthoceras sorbifolium]
MKFNQTQHKSVNTCLCLASKTTNTIRDTNPITPDESTVEDNDTWPTCKSVKANGVPNREEEYTYVVGIGVAKSESEAFAIIIAATCFKTNNTKPIILLSRVPSSKYKGLVGLYVQEIVRKMGPYI